VTLRAKFRAGFDQKGAVLRGVGVVAIHAPAVDRGFVHHRCLGRIVVAPDAQVGRSLGEERRVVGTVGIVAGQAPVVFDDGMDPHPRTRLVVALVAKSVAFFDEDQFVGVAVIIMARLAVGFFKRRMDGLHPGYLLGPFSVTVSAVGCLGGTGKNGSSQNNAKQCE
jgi:hypothetical protein